jgi:hypothetical protein
MITAWHLWVHGGRSNTPQEYTCKDDYTGTRPRTLRVFGSHHLHILTAYIGQLFNAHVDKILHIEDMEQAKVDLFISFVNQTVGEALGIPSIRYFEDEDRKYFDKMLSQIPQFSSYGGLTYAEGQFKFSTEKEKRLNQDGFIDPAYCLSWEIYWIL